MPKSIAEQANAELTKQLMQRAMADKAMPSGPLVPHEGPSAPTPLNPGAVSLLAGLGDAASTYNFLNKGTSHEDNAMWGGNANPMKVAAGVELENLITNAGLHMARKTNNKILRKLADLAQANFATHQTGLAANNLDLGGGHLSSDERTTRQIMNGILGQQTPY
jgi:hypothetical protein